MSIDNFGRGMAFATALVTLAACGKDDVTAPVVQQAELSQLLNQASAPGAPQGVLSVMGVPMPALVPSSCSYVAASSSFACPAHTFAGVTATRSFQLLDGSGAPQASFTPSVVSIRMTTDIAGTLTPPAIPNSPVPVTIPAATIERREVLTLTGLGATDQRRISGTANTTVSSTVSFNGPAVPLTVTGADTISNLVLPATPGSASQPAFPLSGSLINVERVALGGLAPFSQTVRTVTTFNGTSTVTFTATTAGRTTTCTVNLAVRPPAPSCS